MSEYESARSTNTLLNRAHNDWANSRVFDSLPGLKGQLVSALQASIGGREIEYVTADLTRGVLEGRVAVTAFTEGLVAEAESNANDVTVTVRARARIESVEVLEAPNLLAGDFTANTKLQVRVTLAGRTILLPGDLDASDLNRDELSTFYGSLLADLEAFPRD